MPTRSWRASSYQVSGAAPLQSKVVIDPFPLLPVAPLQLTAAFRLATLLQDGHHVLSARGGTDHKGSNIQLPQEEGVSRLARDLQKRARIGAARALVRVRSRRKGCIFFRIRKEWRMAARDASVGPTSRGHGARVRCRLHFSPRLWSFPGKDRGTRNFRPENAWRLAEAPFILHLRYGRDITEDVSGIAKINHTTRSIECCYP